MAHSIKQILIEKNFFSLLDYGLLIPFDIFWVKNSGAKTLLKRKGDFGKIVEVKKYQERGAKIDLESHLDETWLVKTMEQLGYLLDLEAEEHIDPSKIQEWRKEFIKSLIPYLWEGSSPTSKLDICFAFGTFFYDLDESEEEAFLNFPIEIQRKNYLSACFGTCLAIVLGYTQSQFLRDYFKILLFMDFPFSLNMWSESEKSFLIKEWGSVGSDGSAYKTLKSRIKGKYIIEVGRAKKEFCKKIKFSGIVKYLDFSFERLNGTGFPHGLHGSGMSDLDALTVFLYHRFSFEENINEESKLNLLKELFNVSPEFKKVSLSIRMENLITSSIKKVQVGQNEYLAISGL